jgi:hypothetical protein
MGKRHFEAVCTDSGCIIGCPHKHRNVITATACVSQPGGYVVAIDKHGYEELNEAEELQFQSAMYGRRTFKKRVADLGLLIKGRLKT